MCLCPTYIKNPYFNTRSLYLGKKSSDYGFAYLHDTVSQELVVPCGVCTECLFLKQQYIVQRAELVSSDHFVFFGTLTFNNAHLPSVTDSLGNVHYYVDSKYFYHMMHRIRFRKEIPEGSKIIYVEEFGGKRHRPHVHFLLFYPYPSDLDFRFPNKVKAFIDKEEKRLYKLFFKEWAINKGTRKHPVYEPLFTFKECIKHGEVRKNFDFHYVRTDSYYNLCSQPDDYAGKTELDVAAYVTKYVLKYDPWFKNKKQYLHEVLPPDEYEDLIRLIKPRVTISKHFGDSPKYDALVRKGIDYALSRGHDFKGFKYFSPRSGTYKPLAPYLKRKFVRMSDMERWYHECAELIPGSRCVAPYDSAPPTIAGGNTFQKEYHGVKVFDYLNDITLDDFADIDELNI